MPAAIPFVAAAFLSAGAVASAVGISLGIAFTIGTLAVTWTAVLAVTGIALMAVSYLARKTPKPDSAGSQLQLKLDPQAAVPVAYGRTATGGNMVARQTWGSKNAWLGFVAVLSAGGPVQAIESYKAGDYQIGWSTNPTSAPATAVSVGDYGSNSKLYKNKLHQRWQNGAAPSNTTVGAASGQPFALGAMSGLAHAIWWAEWNQDAFPQGMPNSLWVLQGVKLYDPRKDLTYPGGAGPHRRDQPSTWTYSENPYLAALQWTLGRWENSKRVYGIGAKWEEVDVASFVNGANVADANNWKVGGVVTTNDDKFAVLASLLASGGGVPVARGAQIAVSVNAPKTSVLTLTKEDIIGEVEISSTTSWRDRQNTIVPRYREESQNWEIISGERVSAPLYVTEDGGETKTIEVEYPLVQQAAQAHQLATYELCNSREFLTYTVNAKVRFLSARVGDAIFCNVPEIASSNQKCVIVGREYNPADMSVTLSLKSETDAKHAFALGQSQIAPPSPKLDGYDPSNPAAPSELAWSITDTTISNDDATLPVIVISGATDDPNASTMIVEYRPLGSSTWLNWGEFPRTTTRVEINSLTSGTNYEVAVSYRTNLGVIGARLILSAQAGAMQVDWSNVVSGSNKPQDNATYGAPNGSPVGGRPAEQVVSDVDTALEAVKNGAGQIIKSEDLRQGLSTLQITYGTTQSAQAYADAAQAAAQASNAAKTDAEKAFTDAASARDAGQAILGQVQSAYTSTVDAKTLTLAARDQASSAATLADASRQDAQASRDVAASARDEAARQAAAALSAQGAAATSASLANGFKTEAFDSAQAASATLVQARTTRDESKGWADAASRSASGASSFSDAASQRASAAQQSEINAATEAGRALVSSESAASSKRDAESAASSAFTQSGIAVSAKDAAAAARDTAQDIINSQQPATLSPVERGAYFLPTASSTIDGPGDQSWPQPYISHNPAGDPNTTAALRFRKLIPRIAGRRYRFTGWIYSYATNLQFSIAIYGSTTDSPSFSDVFYGQWSEIVKPQITGWNKISGEVLTDDMSRPYFDPVILIQSTNGQPNNGLYHTTGIVVEDVTSEVAAFTSASASAISASAASAARDTAGERADAASRSALAANTSSGEALSYRNDSARSAQDALGSQQLASTQVGLATVARTSAEAAQDAAQKLINAQFPPVLDPEGRKSYDYSGQIIGPDASWPNPYIIQKAGGHTGYDFNHKRAFPKVVGRRYRLETWVFSYSTNARFVFGLYDFASIDPLANARFIGNLSETSSAGGSSSVTPQTAGFYKLATEFEVASTTQAFIRPFVRVDSANGQTIGGVTHIAGITITDITSEAASKIAASAAVTSASTASSKATEAQQSADAASRDRLAAGTSASDAQSYKDAAVNASQSAAGSLSQATSQVGLATVARTAAETAQIAAQNVFNQQFPPTLDPIGRLAYDYVGEYYGPSNYPTPYIIAHPPGVERYEFRFKAAMPRVVGRRYRLETWIYSNATNAQFRWGLHDFSNERLDNVRWLGLLSEPSSAGGVPDVTPATGSFIKLSCEFTIGQTAQNFIRPFVLVTSSDGQLINAVTHVGGITITDITSEAESRVAATAAAGSASNASSKSDQAGQSAQAASGSATAANTSAGNAKTSETNASTSESNALGSKVAAASSASLSVSARDSSQDLLNRQFPPTLAPIQRDAYFLPGNVGIAGPDNWPQPYITVTDPNTMGSEAHISFKRLLPRTAGKRYRVTAWVFSYASNVQFFIGHYGATADDAANIDTWYGTVGPISFPTTTGWNKVSGEFATDSFSKPFIGLHLIMQARSGTSNDATIHTTGMVVEDITSESAAATSAAAAVTSASAASAANDQAGQRASAARQSETNASTSEGKASTYETRAASSADRAGTSEQLATQASGIAVTQAGNAGRSAQAAVDAAATATTKSGEAGTSAEAASAAKIAAQGFRDNASTSATLAAGSLQTTIAKADAAAGSAETATNAATQAGSYRDQSSSYATQAESSKNIANGLVASATLQNTIASSYSASGVAKNDKFANWPNAGGYPEFWNPWVADGNFRIERTEGIGSPYAVRTSNDFANVDSGLIQTVPIYNGKWVIEATARLDYNTWNGSGVTLSGVWSIDFARHADTNGVVAATGVGTTRTWSKLFTINNEISGLGNLHAMHSWGGFGLREARYMTWFSLKLRPATQPEIDGNKALADGAVTSAAISTLQSTTAGQGGSIATLTQTVGAQTGSISSLQASVSTQASAIADAAGKLQAYMVNEVSASDGRAIVSLRANGQNGSSNIDLAASQIRLLTPNNGNGYTTALSVDGNEAVFSGKLRVGVNKTGARTVITDAGVKIYDANGVLRVNLSS